MKCEDALNLKQEHELTGELFASHNALGLLAYYENLYVDASTHLDAALRSSNADGKVGDYATARQNLALVQTEWETLEQRNRERWVGYDYTEEMIREKLEGNDLPNARLVHERSTEPDWIIRT